ncbi:MAG TPA: TonB-dependent receptor [bacterium]|nr:TonB-dependent receptor [bacterium]
MLCGRRKARDASLISLIFLLLLLCPYHRAWADPSPGDTASLEMQLDTTVVFGDEVLSERKVENPTKFMTVIDVGETPGRVETVADVLRDSVGVQINSLGGLGSFSTASIRGSSASQVQVFLDGVPMNRASSGVTNIADLPLDNIAYIEVFRGITPADFGAAGIGGAINLVTRKGAEKGGQAGLSYGSYQTLKADAMASGPVGKVNALVFAGHESSQGDFTYDNDNGTPANSHDDFTDTRVNNDFSSYDLTARLAGGAEWELAGIATGHYKDQGLPGLAAAQARSTRYTTGRATLTLSARNRSLLDDTLDLTLGADGLYDDETLDDPEGELGGQKRKTENRMATAGARAKAIWRFAGDDGILTTFTEYREESFTPVQHVPRREEGKEQTRSSLAAVVQVELTDPSGKWTIQPALRQEWYWNRISGDPNFSWSRAAGDNTDTLELTSPSIGLRYRASDTLVLKANAGRFYRVPTFYELFGDRGVAVGNTGLMPERGVNFDLGFACRGYGSGPLHDPYLEYAFFQSRVDDLILFFQNSQRTIRAVNIGAARVGGHELSFGFGLFDDWRLSGNYTFQAAVDQGDVAYWQGNALPLRPMHEAYGRIEYAPERWKVWAEADYVSGNYWDRANLYQVPDRRVYNMGTAVDLYKKNHASLDITVETKNLADDRIADVAGYPLPGRSYFITVQGKW